MNSFRSTLIISGTSVSTIGFSTLEPFAIALYSSIILSSLIAREEITAIIWSNASFSEKPNCSSIIIGIIMYPKSLPSNLLNALPAAWTISILLCFGSANKTASIEGTSTPSVRQRALVIKLGSASINLWISAALSPVLFLPETWNVDNFLKFLLTFVNSEFRSLKSLDRLILLWKETICLIFLVFISFLSEIIAARVEASPSTVQFFPFDLIKLFVLIICSISLVVTKLVTIL